MEQTQRSETSAIKHRTPGNNPKHHTQHLEHAESLKSRTTTYSVSHITIRYERPGSELGSFLNCAPSDLLQISSQAQYWRFYTHLCQLDVDWLRTFPVVPHNWLPPRHPKYKNYTMTYRILRTIRRTFFLRKIASKIQVRLILEINIKNAQYILYMKRTTMTTKRKKKKKQKKKVQMTIFRDFKGQFGFIN
jgi:hypothetical protein